MVEIQFVKTHEDAVLPCQANVDDFTGDSGYDLYCVVPTIIPARGSSVVPVGLKVGYITPGYWVKVESRSGLSFRFELLANPGIIDNQYRGDMSVKVYNHSGQDFEFKKGDKIAQMIIYKLIQAQISWTDKVEETSRGEKGFGSSDKKNVPDPPKAPASRFLKEGDEPPKPGSITVKETIHYSNKR